MDYYNQKRCVDGKGLVLPSQIVSSCSAIGQLGQNLEILELLLEF